MVFRRMFGRPARIAGRPPSGNGASSFHLHWQLPPSAPLIGVQATFEVVHPPQVENLYFWALQASFGDGRRTEGGAHLGLQWNSRHPGRRAANWGGYHHSGRILDGSGSALPSTPNDPNTRDYAWRPHTPYRFRITRVSDGWRGEIADLTAGTSVAVRDLYSPGTELVAPMVWSEVFAPCEAPQVAVRWSAFGALTVDRQVVVPGALRVNYQAYEAGGCSNTNVLADGDGVVQVTNTERTVPQGTVTADFTSM
ncbi:MAG: hypothetical protein ACR2NL_12620 [Acidimicrobiia bacterium]